MKKIILMFVCINSLLSSYALAETANKAPTPISPVAAVLPESNSQLSRIAGLYAEKKALYREIFTNAYEKIINQVYKDKLASNKWGVVFALDGTLLDKSNLQQANPGAAEITCKIKGMNGRVIIVTNRSSKTMPNTNYIGDTSRTISSQGICYDSIIFANNDTSKNPRFSAISSGDYENIIATKKLPMTRVIAYFGSSILDFPDLKQNLADSLPIKDPIFSDFGQKYFMLPR